MLTIDRASVLICPACHSPLSSGELEMNCESGHYYRIDNGVPLLFSPNEWSSSKKDVTETVKSFYEETPFPNYDGIESVDDLIREAKKGIFACLLNEQISANAKVLEAGCGTGQLSNFLAAAKSERQVIGTDICQHSLALAQTFKIKHRLERVEFYQMNLFNPVFKPETFDLVICNGVLHHTSDPYLGFQTLSKLVKKGGFIFIGLYNSYGRFTTNIRRSLFNLSNSFRFLDPRLRRDDLSHLKKETWFLDQYKHPHESKHTMDEVLHWFRQNGFEFVNGVPKLKPFEQFSENEKLFEPSPVGDWLDHFQVQMNMIFSSGANGGFFIMIGKKI